MKKIILGLLLAVCAFSAPAAQPLVAVHDSEVTRALETAPATGNTPQETGYQWWLEDFHYFVMPDSVKEMLRSDGTAFATVSDADISAGHLLDTNGQPAYPIVISLAAEAMNDSEITNLTNYIAAGGFLLVGSSSFTRNPDGTTRGDFAIANAMGIHMANNNLVNWVANSGFTKTSNHRLVAHVTGGPLNWLMPRMASDISGGVTPYHSPPGGHLFWLVNASDATVIAQGDNYPYMTVKHYGKGWIIYTAALEPLIGHGALAPGMYAYGIFRNAVQWAFESAKMPVTKLSPWPYPYDAAFMIRHDLLNFQQFITDLEASAYAESQYGAYGDYYFNTGTLRVEMTNSPSVIASLRLAVGTYNASIGPANGGLQNPDNLSLATNNGDFWGWGPDEALDLSSGLPGGYTNGFQYSLASVSNSFNDVEGWLSGLTNGIRSWAAPNFNATREGSLQIEEQLNVRTTGDDKLTPFPSWVLSTSTADKRYPFITLPVSDYFYGPSIPSSLEAHYPGSMHDLVDTYYGIGGLVNLNSHSLSTGEEPNYAQPGIAVDYLQYAMNPALHPRLWPANAFKIYTWWLARSNAQISATCVTNGNQSITTFSINGATDPQTAVEMVLPGASASGLQVLTNGVVASTTNSFRTNGQNVKIFVGTAVTNAQVRYVLNPTAKNDFYITMAGQALTVPAVNGVLSNDFAGLGSNLTASLTIAPASGLLTLNSDGSFNYTPASNFTGMATFSYVANDGVTNSLPATCTIDVTPNASLFYDDFGRSTNADPLTPWTRATGNWGISNGVMYGTASGINDYSDCYFPGPWRDYSVQSLVRLETNSWAGGLSGRVDPLSGAKYTANIYEEGDSTTDPLAWPGGGAALRIIKFHTYRTWDLNPSAMAFVQLPPVGTNWHTLKMSFKGPEIKAYFDGLLVADVIDNNLDGIPAFLTGGISVHMYMDNPHTAAFDNLIVMPLPSDDSYATAMNQQLNVAAPGVLTNDMQGLVTNLTAALVSTTTNGSLTFNSNGSFTYSPANNFTGTDSFVYSASSGATNLGQATVTITVAAGNHPPTLPNQGNLVVSAQVLMTVTNTATDTDSPPQQLTYTLTSAPTNAAISTNGIITWTPSLGQIGTTNTFTTVVTDNGTPNLSATNSFQVVVSASIAANNDSYNETYGLPLTVSPPGVLANDSGGSGPLHANLMSNPAHGSLSFSTNGGFTYAATNNFTGTDTFTYQASDGVTNSATATVSIAVSADHPPVANADSYTVLAGNTLAVTAPGVLANDTDADGNALTAVLATGPAHGTLTLTNNGGFTYTPGPGFGGTDSFVYMANDGVSNSAPATVTISVLSGGILFFDNFTRATDPGPLTPWVGVPAGSQLSDNWTVSGGMLQAGLTDTLQTYAFAYLPTNNWTNFSVQAKIQFANTSGVGGGIGGRLNSATGTHYGAWVYPDGSPGGANQLKLFKFTSYINFSYNNNAIPIQTASLPSVGTNWHTLKLAFNTNNIAVYYDGTLMINTTDTEAQPYGSGTICAERGTYLTDYNFLVDDVLVNDLGLPAQPNDTVNELTTLTVTNTATDTQFPGQTVTYSLLNAPTNMTISTNGVITWTPTMAQDHTTNLVTTRVVDNDTPPASATNTFLVFVTQPAPTITSAKVATGSATLTWTTLSNLVYRLQYKTNLTSTNWISVVPDITATNSSVTATNALGGDRQRFYRVMVLP